MDNPLATQVAGLVDEVLHEFDISGINPLDLLEVPPTPAMGDFAFPCFQLARTLRKAPPKIAEDIQSRLSLPDWIERVEVAGAYVNFYLNPANASASVLKTVFDWDLERRRSQDGDRGVVVIDFSSPNIAKPFHVGHLRSTMIGNSLARLFEHHGYRVVRLNYLGDWGTQFGKLIVAYRRWGDKESLTAEPIKALLDLYVKFHREAEDDPGLEDEARAAFLALEEGRDEEMALWQWFRDLSLQEFKKHYKRLDVEFDTFDGESTYNTKVKQTVADMDSQGILTRSEGALVVEFEDLPPCLVMKQDGATLYATRDISAAVDRYDTYRFSHLFYVVGAPQQLHFEQVFRVLRLMNYEWVDRAEHIPFGHIRIGDEQLSTRRGNVIFLEDLLDQAVQRAAAIIEERNPDLANKEEVAEAVGVGAIVFNDLSHNRIKDISFEWDSILNFEGDTGPYVQYTHARACSLLRRGNQDGQQLNGSEVDGRALSEPETFQLVKRMAAYPEVLKRAKEQREPSEIARYLLSLCQDFNSFYHAHRIIGSDHQSEKLVLVAGVKRLLAHGLYLLGVKAPEEM